MKRLTIEVDETTETILKARARERGMTVSEFVADLVATDAEPIAVDPEHIAELDRRWNAHQTENAGVPHEDVVRWLRTWGTFAFREQRD